MKHQKLLFVIALSLLNLSAFHYFKFYERFVSGGDSWGYYAHLPSTFIYHDVGDYSATKKQTKLQFPAYYSEISGDNFGAMPKCKATGKQVIKYTNGVAIMLLPFFGAAHFYCKYISHTLADGFSLPYLLALGWGVLFWLGVAYYFLTTVLRRYFSKYVTAITVVALAFGTNIFYNTTYNGIMSHPFLFVCCTLLIFQTDTYYKNPTQKRLILVALSAAMLILLRLNELYALFIPLLWNITNFETLKLRFQWIFSNIKQYVIAAICAFIVFIPQIIYWKTLTGKFVYDGYIDEHFDFKHPHIYEGWFAYNNGWLLWSPVMVLALLGIVFLYKHAKAAFVPLLIILPLHTYIIYSWWCFQYINGFGSRPMEDIYPLLAFGFASGLTFLFQRKITTVIGISFIILCVSLNLFQTWQQHKGLIFTEMMNKGYYWGIFGQTQNNKNAILGYASNEVQPQNITVLKSIFKTDFNDTTNRKNIIQPQNSSPMRRLQQQCDTIAWIDIDDKLDAKYFNVKIKNLFHADAVNGDIWSLPLVIFRFKDANGNDLCDSSIKPHILVGNTENTIWTQGKPDVCESIVYNMKIHQRSKVKKLLVCTWNPRATPFYIDDLEVALAK